MFAIRADRNWSRGANVKLVLRLSLCGLAAGTQTRLGMEEARRYVSSPLSQDCIGDPGCSIGNGVGRAMYQLNTVELPPVEPGRRCIAARMDRFTHSLSIDTGEQDANSVAYGCYDDQVDATGWGQLEISTTVDQAVPLVTRAYAAGLLEGMLTAYRMTQFHKNVAELMVKDIGAGEPQLAVERVIRMALIAWEELAGGDAGMEPEDDIPRAAWVALIQMRGLRDGNNYVAGTNDTVDSLSAFQVMLMNMHAEIPAITQLYAKSFQGPAMQEAASPGTATFLTKKLDPMQNQTNASGPTSPWPRWSAHTARGSAIVKRVGSRGSPEDLISGHVTFGDYGEMHRVYKHYNLNYGGEIKSVAMTSYPGCISSTDDYMINDLGFVLMSTNLWIPAEGNFSIPAKTNEGLPSFLRSLMATRLATQPRMWAKIYQYMAGIAGGKQWLVANYAQFKTNQALPDDTVWLIEALPRMQRAGDVSENLRENGFFQAHGVPHFGDIRELYGLPREVPDSYAEMKSAGLIEKAATIGDMASVRQVLVETNPSRDATGTLLEVAPINTRNDLLASAIPEGAQPVADGGIDAKATNHCMVQKLATQGRSGPPLDSDGNAFSWTGDSFEGWPHAGLPETFDFPWVNLIKGASPTEVTAATSDLEECVPGAS